MFYRLAAACMRHRRAYSFGVKIDAIRCVGWSERVCLNHFRQTHARTVARVLAIMTAYAIPAYGNNTPVHDSRRVDIENHIFEVPDGM